MATKNKQNVVVNQISELLPILEKKKKTSFCWLYHFVVAILKREWFPFSGTSDLVVHIKKSCKYGSQRRVKSGTRVPGQSNLCYLLSFFVLVG